MDATVIRERRCTPAKALHLLDFGAPYRARAKRERPCKGLARTLHMLTETPDSSAGRQSPRHPRAILKKHARKLNCIPALVKTKKLNQHKVGVAKTLCGPRTRSLDHQILTLNGCKAHLKGSAQILDTSATWHHAAMARAQPRCQMLELVGCKAHLKAILLLNFLLQTSLFLRIQEDPFREAQNRPLEPPVQTKQFYY